MSVYVNNELRSGCSSSWFKHLKAGSYMDDHFIMGAVSEIGFSVEDSSASTLTSSKIMTAASQSSNTMQYGTSQTV